MAYIDIDNFKYVNDERGHKAGDELLIHVANCMKSIFREEDIIARLGGDEFVVMTPGLCKNSAKQRMENSRDILTLEMEDHSWPVGFSIGVVYCDPLVSSLDDVLLAADSLMYEVKKSGKSGIRFKCLD